MKKIDNQTMLDIFNFRHACKVFDESKTVAKEDIITILEAARLSPSSLGFEAWRFIADSNRERMMKFEPSSWGAKTHLPTCSYLVIGLYKTEKHASVNSDYAKYIYSEVKKIDVKYYEENILPYFAKFQEAMTISVNNWSEKQTYIALADMMVTAAALGIDTCPIEGFDRIEATKILESEYGVNPEDEKIAFMMAVGYRKEEPKPKARRKAEEVYKIID